MRKLAVLGAFGREKWGQKGVRKRAKRPFLASKWPILDTKVDFGIRNGLYVTIQSSLKVPPAGMRRMRQLLNPQMGRDDPQADEDEDDATGDPPIRR